MTQELAEKTPALQQLRKDHDQAITNCNQLTSNVNTLFEECETLRLESQDSVKQARATERENARLKMLVGDMGRQVKVSPAMCMCLCIGVSIKIHVYMQAFFPVYSYKGGQMDYLNIFRGAKL